MNPESDKVLKGMADFVCAVCDVETWSQDLPYPPRQATPEGRGRLSWDKTIMQMQLLQMIHRQRNEDPERTLRDVIEYLRDQCQRCPQLSRRSRKGRDVSRWTVALQQFLAGSHSGDELAKEIAALASDRGSIGELAGIINWLTSPSHENGLHLNRSASEAGEMSQWVQSVVAGAWARTHRTMGTGALPPFRLGFYLGYLTTVDPPVLHPETLFLADVESSSERCARVDDPVAHLCTGVARYWAETGMYFPGLPALPQQGEVLAIRNTRGQQAGTHAEQARQWASDLQHVMRDYSPRAFDGMLTIAPGDSRGRLSSGRGTSGKTQRLGCSRGAKC